MDQQLRKTQAELKICARGLVFLGLWDLAKVLMYRYFAPEYLISLAGQEFQDETMMNALLLGMMILAGISLLIRFFISRRAISECTRDRGRFYLIMAGALCALSAASLIGSILQLIEQPALLNSLSAILLHGILIEHYVRLIVLVLRIRKLRRQDHEEVSGSAA